LTYKQKEEMNMQGNCVICDGNILLDENIIVGEIVCCPDCGTELEVLSVEPLELAEAPEVEEDWGE
jgi:alpha-aminoadipate carrier protein LysW